MKNNNDFSSNDMGELSMLVRSLKKNEQKQLRNYIEQQKNGPLLKARMLEQLIKLTAYNEVQLKQKLKIGAPQFITLKKELIEDVTSFLLNDKTKISSKIGLFRTCVQHNVPHIAEKFLKEIRTIQHLQYLPHLKLDFLKAEYDFFCLTNARKTTQSQIALEEKINVAIKVLYDYELLLSHLRKLVHLRTVSNVRVTNEEMQDARLEYEFLNGFEFDRSHPVLCVLHQTNLAIAGYLCHEKQTTLKATETFLSVWQNKPELATLYPDVFLESSKICFYIYFLWSTPSEARELSFILDRIACERLSGKDSDKWKVIMFHTRLKVFLKTAGFNGVQKLVEDEWAQILEYSRGLFSLKDHLSIAASVCLTQFILGNFKNADELMYEIKDLNKTAQAEDIFYFSSVFHLMILFELKDWYRFQLTLDAAYRQLYKLKKKRAFEKELMLFLKKLSNLSTMPRYRDHTVQFMKKLEIYRQDPVTKLYFLYFNYYGWLSSKLEGIDYKLYVARSLGLSAPL